MSNPVIEGPEIFSMIMSMLIVVGAVVALGWLYSRLRFNSSAGGDVINILASRGLGPKERLLLVEVGDKQLLVGITASSVQTLHTFERPVVTASPVGDVPGFADRLRSVMRSTTK